jgi:HK97 family phage portal protein
MPLLDRIRSAFGRKASQLTYDQIADAIDGMGGRTVAGVTVSASTALQVSTVLACVKVIADGCATPKLHVYRELSGRRREIATNIPEYRLLARRPNEWQTSYEWRRQMTVHAALTGTGLSLKVRGDNRRVRELIPIQPGQWDVRRVGRYELRYRVWDEWGYIGEFTPEDVFVLNGLQWDWVRAMDAVSLARASVGLAIASERSQAGFHENGVKISGIYSVDGTLSAEQHERLRGALKRAATDRAGEAMVLDRSAKFQPTSMTSVDAQHLETRRMQVEEVCRAFGVFPLMVGHSDKTATFASSEAFFAAHVKHTLAPWHAAWTQRIDEMLLDGSGPLYGEFDTRYLLAGSMSDRARWARTMAEMGIYTRNELRDEEGKDPIEGLDDPLTPMNMSGGGDGADGDEDDAQTRAIGALERKLDAAMNVRAAPPSVVLHSTEIERQMKSAVDRLADSFAAQIAELKDAMPIIVNVPQQAAPTVNVDVAAPVVTFEATMPEPVVTIVDSHPSKATTVVERDETNGIGRTVTTYER